MPQKLAEQINRYFNLMEKIREQLFRTIRISDRYLCIVSFSTQYQSVCCDLVSKESLLPAKLLEGLTGKELVAYGTILDAVEQWASDGMVDDFPIEQDVDAYDQYRKLVSAEPERERKYPKEQLNNIRSDLLTLDAGRLAELAQSLGLKLRPEDKEQELREALFKFYGIDANMTIGGKHHNETTAEYIESLPTHIALQELGQLDLHQLHMLADAWALDKSDDQSVMLSLAKGHILRSLKERPR